MNRSLYWTILAGAALLLSACGGSTPPTTDQPTVTTIQGKVQTWNGAGTVRLPELSSVSAPVAADGTFALTLPTDSALSSALVGTGDILSKIQCQGSLGSSNAVAKGYAVLTLNAQDTVSSRQVFAATASGSLLSGVQVEARAWVYTDVPTTISGEVDCAKVLNVPQVKSIPVKVNVAAKSGWNVVALNLQASVLDLLGGKGKGTLVNATDGTGTSTWRTANEITAPLGF